MTLSLGSSFLYNGVISHSFKWFGNLFLIALLIHLVQKGKFHYFLVRLLESLQLGLYLGWLAKFLTIFCTLPSEIFDWRGQSNSSRESVTDSKCQSKVFAILMFWVKIAPFLFKATFESPKDCFLEKYGSQLFQKGFESKKGFKLSKCFCLDWLFNLTT